MRMLSWLAIAAALSSVPQFCKLATIDLPYLIGINPSRLADALFLLLAVTFSCSSS